MKKTLIVAALFATASFAHAQSIQVDSGAGATATAPVTVENVIGGSVTPARQTLDQNIRDRRASTAPATVGAVGAIGCPALESMSGSVFFFNGSKTTATELAGCMGLQLAAMFDGMAIGPNGEVDFKGYAKIQAACDFPQYRVRINRIGFQRVLKAAAPATATSVAVAAVTERVTCVDADPAPQAAPGAAQAPMQSPDPIVRDSGRQWPSRPVQ